MVKLMEWKDRIFKFCGEFETYLIPVYKFIVAIVLFMIINNSIGYMERISTFPMAMVLALICCVMPQSMTIFMAAFLVLLNLYALSLEVAVTALVVFLLLFFLYFRFAPQNGLLFVLTPIFCKLNIPYVLPIGSGLLGKAYSILAVVGGLVSYYFVDGIYQNVTTLASTMIGEEEQISTKISVAVGQLLLNKEMYLMIIITIITGLVVYVVRRLAVEYAWKIAIVAGGLVQISGLFAGYLILNISDKTIAMIIGNIVSMFLGFVIEFFFMDLDYERTERVQFDDDEYYYYVKAVPKKMVSSSEKTVHYFNSASSLRDKFLNIKGKNEVDKKSKEDEYKVIAEELDIDEKLLK